MLGIEIVGGLLGVLLLSVVAMLVKAQPAQAALPPRSSESLQAQARLIVVGKVEAIGKRVIELQGESSDWDYSVTIKVEAIEKNVYMSDPEAESSPALPQLEETFVLHYRQTGERPSGWVGPVGQYQQPQLGDRGRFFLSLDARDNWAMIEPNGWEKVL